MIKYGVVVEEPLCSICGRELDTSTTPPTCPKCGTRGIEKRSEDGNLLDKWTTGQSYTPNPDEEEGE